MEIKSCLEQILVALQVLHDEISSSSNLVDFELRGQFEKILFRSLNSKFV